MNSINRFLLKALLSPVSLYEKAGINTEQLKAILTVKLIMDDRRTNSFQRLNQNRKKEKEVSNATLGTMLMALIMGAFFLFAFAIQQSFTIQLTFYFSFFIFMLASILITDFTSVLIDVRDNYIILPKPVNDRTVLMARLLHIIAHISKVVLPMFIPGLIAIAVMKQAGVLLVIPIIVLIILITIFFINAVYLVILKITTPQKFQNVITYFQIFFAIIIYGSYQVLPRMLENAQLQKWNIESSPYLWLLPPYWFALAWDTLYHLHFTNRGLVALFLSVIVPIFTIWIVIRFFASSFNKKLSMIGGSGAEANVPAQTVSKKVKQKSFFTTLSEIFTSKGAERAGFLFASKMMSRSREFKLKVYPSVGYLIVYLFIILFTNKKLSISRISTDVTTSKIFFITVLYFSTFLLYTVLQQFTLSERWKASWIYFITPVTKPGYIIAGGIKAAIVKFFLPGAILISTASIFFWGLGILPNLFFGFTVQIFLALINSLIFVQKIPFSSEPVAADRGGSFMKGIFLLMISGVFGLLHYFLYDYHWILLVLGAIVIGGIYLLFKKIRNKTWPELKMEYNG